MSFAEWAMLVVALILTVFAGLLAATESALQSISKAGAGVLIEEGRPGAARISRIANDPAPFLNTVLFVRLCCEIGAIVMVAFVIFRHIDPSWLELLTAAGIMIIVSFVAWGVAPRTLGRQHAYGLSRVMALVVVALTFVLGPIPRLLILIGNALTPGKGFAEGPFASEAELRELVDMAEASDVIEANERKMIHSVFDLGDTIVREVMVPRPDMVVIEGSKTLRQAMSLALRSGFSRIPVIGEDIDDVIGVFYLKDAIRRVYDNADSQSTELVSAIMRTATWCPDSKPAAEELSEMQRTRSHLTMVVDEFGGVAGLITIEDILEEIVGEIVDEYDDEVPLVTELAPDRFRVSSRLPIDELGELFGLKVDDEDVETVGGLMAKQLNMVPIAGSVVQWEGLELTAERSTRRRNQHRTVLVTREELGEAATEAAAELATESAKRET